MSDRSAPSGASLATRTRQPCPHGGFTAGQPDGREPELLHEDPRHALDLLEREELLARQPLHPFVRHAIAAAEIAAVGDGDPQVPMDAAMAVDEGEGIAAQGRGSGACPPSGGRVAVGVRPTRLEVVQQDQLDRTTGLDPVAVRNDRQRVRAGRRRQLMGALSDHRRGHTTPSAQRARTRM